MRKNEHFYRKP